MCFVTDDVLSCAPVLKDLITMGERAVVCFQLGQVTQVAKVSRMRIFDNFIGSKLLNLLN